MTNCLQVVSAGLLVAYVSVDTGIASCSSQVLALSEGDVLSVGGAVALGQTKVDDVDIILCGIVAANEEVVRFYVSVNNALLMYDFNSLNLFKN